MQKYSRFFRQAGLLSLAMVFTAVQVFPAPAEPRQVPVQLSPEMIQAIKDKYPDAKVIRLKKSEYVQLLETMRKNGTLVETPSVAPAGGLGETVGKWATADSSHAEPEAAEPLAEADDTTDQMETMKGSNKKSSEDYRPSEALQWTSELGGGLEVLIIILVIVAIVYVFLVVVEGLLLLGSLFSDDEENIRWLVVGAEYFYFSGDVTKENLDNSDTERLNEKGRFVGASLSAGVSRKSSSIGVGFVGMGGSYYLKFQESDSDSNRAYVEESGNFGMFGISTGYNSADSNSHLFLEIMYGVTDNPKIPNIGLGRLMGWLEVKNHLSVGLSLGGLFVRLKNDEDAVEEQNLYDQRAFFVAGMGLGVAF